MWEFISKLIDYMATGGAVSIIAILVVLLAFLLWDRYHMVKALDDTTKKVYDAKDSEIKSIKEIIDTYHKGNIDLIQALTEIKIVLVTLQHTVSK